MSLLFIYFVKVSICLAIVYLFYQLVLRNLTFYNSNRWYLVGYSLLSFFIPLIDITPVLEKNSFNDSKIVQFIPIVDESGLAINNNAASPVNSSFSSWGPEAWLMVALLLGATIFLTRFIFRFLSFYRMRRDAQLVFDKGMRLYQVSGNIIPFSFGNSVFINSELHTEDELREIIRHEYVHVKQKHTIDILWSEWLCIINWYNPFAWLLRSAIRQNLEFIADDKVLEKGVDRKQYQYLLLKVIGNTHFSIAQKFNFSSLKKRIAMMNTLRSAKLNLTRFLFILPLLAVVLIAFRQKQQDPSKHGTVSNATIFSADTVPVISQTNDKGYVIELIDEDDSTIVLIKDKNGKEVDRVLLSEWEDNESYYKKKYGKIPPPPPPVPAIAPMPPSPPVPGKLPDNVKTIEYKYDKVDVLLKDGKKESYDLTVPAQRKTYEAKYGVTIVPPEPAIAPAAPIAPRLPDNVSSIHVKNNRAEVWLKDGNEEVYDLNIPSQKEAFEKKYGNSPIVADPPQPPGLPTKVVRIIKPGEPDKVAALCDDFEINDKRAVMHLKNGQIEEYDLSDTKSRKRFEEKFGKILDVSLTGIVAPAAVISEPAGVTVVSGLSTPVIAAPTLAIAENGQTFSGDEEILVTISKKTTASQLEEFKSKMKERGIELKYDHTDFKEGVLVNISGTIKLEDNIARFSANDFGKLILSTVTNGERVYFRVRVEEKNRII